MFQVAEFKQLFKVPDLAEFNKVPDLGEIFLRPWDIIHTFLRHWVFDTRKKGSRIGPPALCSVLCQ